MGKESYRGFKGADIVDKKVFLKNFLRLKKMIRLKKISQIMNVYFKILLQFSRKDFFFQKLGKVFLF